ncbi:MAG TPA: hypothetical protein VK043_14860 [Burkholderiales bacterium]|nr:hypothetical protein [Burkholderiales bacterium]
MDDFLGHPRHPFTRGAVEGAPQEAGVYGLFLGEELIYVGRATDRDESLRALLLLHQDGALGACTMKATHFAWEVTIWPYARENEVLVRHRRKYRREPRCNADAR